MLPLLQFILTNPWTYFGTLFLLSFILIGVVIIIETARGVPEHDKWE